MYALAVVALLAAVALTAAAVGGALVARHRAMAAADLAALAGADALAAGRAEPCDAAARIASRHAVDLVSCTTNGLVVDVVVGVRVGGIAGHPLVAQMRSRAGPADPADGQVRSLGPIIRARSLAPGLRATVAREPDRSRTRGIA